MYLANFSDTTLSRERGAILVITAILLPLFLAFGFFVVNYGHALLVKEDLQTVADAAAHAGAAALCGRSECYEKARDSAVAIINAASLQGADGVAVQVNGKKLLSSSAAFSAAIERGVWLSHYRNGSGFRSLENRELSYPPYVAANAVRVKLTLNVEGVLAAIYAPEVQTVSAQALASNANSTEQEVAPFALHICSLLNDDGEMQTKDGPLNQNNLLWGDRLFTAVNPYCDSKGRCGIVPSFQYEPFIDAPSGLPPQLTWWNRRYDEAYKHFGVVGVPGKRLDEEAIVSKIGSGAPYFPAKIGDRFSVLGDGLTSVRADQEVWLQITNGYLGQGVHTEFHWAYAGAEFSRLIPSNPAEAQRYQTTSQRPIPGACNGHRAGLTNGALGYYPSYSDLTPVWEAHVPIIANSDSGAGSCKGVNGSSTTPAMDPRADYEIIGFIPVVFFDNDIGTEPPPETMLIDGPGENYRIPQWGFTGGFCNVVRGRISSVRAPLFTGAPIVFQVRLIASG